MTEKQKSLCKLTQPKASQNKVEELQEHLAQQRKAAQEMLNERNKTSGDSVVLNFLNGQEVERFEKAGENAIIIKFRNSGTVTLHSETPIKGLIQDFVIDMAKIHD